MSLTYQQAKDELFSRANAVLTSSDTNTLLGYFPDIRWQGVPKATVPDLSKLWARVSSQIVSEVQASLADSQGVRMYTAVGLIYIELKCPVGKGAIPEKGLALAMALQAKYRQQTTSAELLLRNQRILELPENADNYPINVVAQFEYKTLQPVI